MGVKRERDEGLEERDMGSRRGTRKRRKRKNAGVVEGRRGENQLLPR